MLSLGALDSIRMALTDLAVVLFLALAVAAVRSRRPGAGVVALALAGMTRETGLLGAGVLATRSRGSPMRILLAALPLLLWFAWLHAHLPKSGGIWRGNIDLPCVSLARHAAACLAAVARGDFESRQILGLLGGLGLAFQSLDLLLKRRWSEPWWRAGAGFALLFWILGDQVWNGYWAVARVVLPMTFAYSLLVPRDRLFWLRIAAPNAILVLHGLWRLMP
jgi:hypothetical protein